MRWLFNILKSRTFLITFGVLLLISLIILLGEMFEFSWVYRLLAIIVVMFIVVLILVIQFTRANKSADEIEKSIKKQAEQQLISTRPDKQSEIQELQEQLERAIEQLKTSKLGRGQRGRAALYALPWYLFVGPPGAGKTTAITNSGLNFPLGSDRIRGVGGTRNCDWFFSDQAILLDTAGRYMTEQEDTQEWLSFLDTLKQHRSERPINGVIVGIAMPDLAIATPDEIEWHADNIRRRADELVGRLGVRFPVYLVFTKCDMLQGFVEFFGELSRKDRDQIWGSTLDEAQQQNKNLRAVFDEEFDRLTAALINRRSARLSRPMKREERQKVYAFPLQLESVKENLSLFVGRLFQPNPYQENPVFRGFYFTSGTQEGVPLDRVILAIARQFELPTTGLHQFETQDEAKSYFIKDLFTDVIVPDQYMVQRTVKARRRGSAQRVGVAVAATVLLGLFVLVTVLAMASGRRSLSRTNNAVTMVNAVQWEPGNPRAAVMDLGRVDSLRQQVDNLERTKWYSLTGLSRDGRVHDGTRNLYLRRVRDFIGAYPFVALRNRMNRAILQGSVAGSERDSLYDDLKAFLLLTQEYRRIRSDENMRTFLTGHLANLATGQLVPHARSATQEGELDTQVRRQVAAYVEALRTDSAWAFSPEVNLVSNARNRMVALPGIDGLYLKLRNEGRDELQALSVTIEKAVPPRYQDLLQSNVEVPGFFTKDGWENFVADRIDNLSEDPTGEDWVLGRSTASSREEFGNKDQVEEQLTRRYFEDYAQAWQRFLRSIQITGFRDLSHAATSLQELGNEFESPLAYVLARVTNETRFIEPADEQAEGGVIDAVRRRAESIMSARLRLHGKIKLPGGEETHIVDQHFQRLHRLKADQTESGNASGELYDALGHLQQLGSALNEIKGDDAQVERFAATVLANRGGAFQEHLDGIQRTLRGVDQDVRTQFFEAPVRNAWGTVINVAQQYLNAQWRDQVYTPFQRLAGLYPFTNTSSDDAPISDVEQFFMPQSGVVDVFIDTYLKSYLLRGDIDQRQQWLGRGLDLSRETVQAIQKSQAISSDLFNGGSLHIAFRLQADQPTDRSEGAPAPERMTITVHGQSDTYLMGGRRWVDFDWPGTTGGASLALTTERGPLPEKRYEGAWALFRMLGDARIQCRTSTLCDARWPFEGTGFRMSARYDLERQSASIPFNNVRTFFNFSPPRSLN